MNNIEAIKNLIDYYDLDIVIYPKNDDSTSPTIHLGDFIEELYETLNAKA